MFPALHSRLGHYLLLLGVAALLFLPALGAASLWDIDEGHNAEAAREMLERGDWIVPQFNYQLRVDKPVLLYWLQLAAYHAFGVGEFGARLPSALAAMLTVLLTYEIGRRLFDAATALLAGLVLASSLLVSGSAHFANPDALLNLCTTLTFLFFVHGCFTARFKRSNWLIWIGLATGLGFLAKGPVALVLPAAVIGLFLIWTGQLRQLFSWRLPVGLFVWVLVGVPWFALVGSETKGEFLRGFFLKHNKDRFLAAMEGHSGPLWYHAVSLFAGMLPWSVFLAPALWHAWRQYRAPVAAAAQAADDAAPALGQRRAVQFLACWFGVYFAFFSISQTKLPGYILPLYPAVALVIACFLEAWRRAEFTVPRWVMPASLASLALIGLGVSVGLLAAGDVLPLPIRQRQSFAGLERGVWLGLLPLGGALAAGWALRRQARTAVVTSCAGTAVMFVGALAVWGTVALDAHKAPRALVAMAQARQLHAEVRVGVYEWWQPSLVFYCQREVKALIGEQQALDFLRTPLPVYLFVPAGVWADLETKVTGSHRLLARHWCFYRNCEVVVVTNR